MKYEYLISPFCFFFNSKISKFQIFNEAQRVKGDKRRLGKFFPSSAEHWWLIINPVTEAFHDRVSKPALEPPPVSFNQTPTEAPRSLNM